MWRQAYLTASCGIVALQLTILAAVALLQLRIRRI
jgi:hypothetical protein